MALSVALLEPQIPPNTGNIARLCAATDTSLHLIGPMGFDLHDQKLNRAGLDYWEAVEMWVHPDWNRFRKAVSRERCLYFSTHGGNSYLEAPYRENTVLIFGSETRGLPQEMRDKYADRLYRIPMVSAVRSLNLATAVAVVLYEALRQLGWSMGDGREVP